MLLLSQTHTQVHIYRTDTSTLQKISKSKVFKFIFSLFSTEFPQFRLQQSERENKNILETIRLYIHNLKWFMNYL